MSSSHGVGSGPGAPPRGTFALWAMLCVAVIECVLGTGVVFGFSALQLALAREGTYAELCEASGAGPGALASAGGCEAQKLRFAFVYSVATAAFQVSMMFWGCLLDLRGSAFVRVASAGCSCLGALLMAAANSRAFDAFAPAAALMGVGGAGFFFSHFVLADHFRRLGRFGMVHALLNAAMDAATVTFFAVELLEAHAGVSTRTSFCALAVAYAAFALATPLWGALLEPAADGAAEASSSEGSGSLREEASSDEEALAPGLSRTFRPRTTRTRTTRRRCSTRRPTGRPTRDARRDPRRSASLLLSSRTPSGAPPPPRRLPPSALPFRAQLLTPHFAWLAVWSLCATSRVLYLLGTVQAQARHAGGERSDARAARLVETFNSVLPLVAFATPAFGALLDAHGAGAGLALVNVLGVACYVLVRLPGASAPVLACACFGCFRVWNSRARARTRRASSNESFGRVYGLGANFFNLIAAAAQCPLIASARARRTGGTRSWTPRSCARGAHVRVPGVGPGARRGEAGSDFYILVEAAGRREGGGRRRRREEAAGGGGRGRGWVGDAGRTRGRPGRVREGDASDRVERTSDRAERTSERSSARAALARITRHRGRQHYCLFF